MISQRWQQRQSRFHSRNSRDFRMLFLKEKRPPRSFRSRFLPLNNNHQPFLPSPSPPPPLPPPPPFGTVPAPHRLTGSRNELDQPVASKSHDSQRYRSP